VSSNDVRRLQTLLATKPEIYPEGLITGYFGQLTKKAVQKFQLKYGVVKTKSDSGFGVVGPKTRAKLQEIFGNNN
jgi:peptidoglycan hydrolase-like protein with peptidoglycan-binding domain